MAKDGKSVADPFQSFVASNLDKAIIGTPKGDGGIEPIKSGVAPTSSPVVEVPASATPHQQAAIQAAIAAVMAGKNVTTAENQPQAQTHRDQLVPENVTRAWNPLQPFVATTRLSDMEKTVQPGFVNPNQVIVGASVEVKLKPKDNCSPVLIDTFILLKNLLDGRWLVPGCPRKQDVESTLMRLKSEIEDV